MIRVRSRNKKTALECQIALPRTRLANEVASIAQQVHEFEHRVVADMRFLSLLLMIHVAT